MSRQSGGNPQSAIREGTWKKWSHVFLETERLNVDPTLGPQASNGLELE